MWAIVPPAASPPCRHSRQPLRPSAGSSSSASAAATAPGSSPVVADELVDRRRRTATTASSTLAAFAEPSRRLGAAGELDPERMEHVADAGDRRRAEPQERVRAARERRRDLARNGQDLPPLLEREVGGDQRAASLARLDDHGRAREARR